MRVWGKGTQLMQNKLQETTTVRMYTSHYIYNYRSFFLILDTLSVHELKDCITAHLIKSMRIPDALAGEMSDIHKCVCAIATPIATPISSSKGRWPTFW